MPKAEKKVVKALDSTGINNLVSGISNIFDGVRNKAIMLVLVDCCLRLGGLININMFNTELED